MRRKEPLNLALVIALIAFFVTLMVAVGVFFYHKQVVKRVTIQSQKLEDAEKSLNIDEIDSYKKIDTRISTAKSLILDHNVFTTILKLLEEGTAQNVALTSLAYGKESDNFVLTIAGEAPSYEAAYFQGETFKTMKPMVSRVDISGVNLSTDTGIVNFITKITINQESTKYSKLLEDANRIPAQQEQAVVNTTTTPTVKSPTP